MAVVAGASARESLVCDWLMALFAWLSYTGTKRPELDARNLKSSTCFEGESMARVAAKQFFVCVENDGYPASLEKRKIYVALRDADAEKHGLLRIVDESGDDYLYAKSLFRAIALPEAVRKAVLAAA